MKRQIRTYCIAEFLYALSLSSMMVTYLFFLKSIRMTSLQIGLVCIAFMASHLIFTVPVGIMADRFGRKYSYIVACILNSVAMIYYFRTNGFCDAVIAESIAGLGMAFYDGALTAFTVDKLVSRRLNVNKVLSVSRIANTCAAIIGGSVGALIGAKSLALPFLVCSVIFIVCALYVAVFVKEEKTDRAKKPRRRDCSLIKQSFRHIGGVLHHKILFPLAMMAFASGIAVELFTKMWSLLLEPSVKSQTTFAYIWPIMMLFSVIGNVIGYRAKKKHFPALIVLFRFTTGIALTLSAVASGATNKIVAICLVEIVTSGVRSMSDAEANSYIPSKNRAATLSAYNLVCAPGSIIGLLCGFFADKFSIEATWFWGGIAASLFSLFFGVIYLRNKKISPDSR